MANTKTGIEFGFDSEVLPEELREMVKQLEEHAAGRVPLKKKTRKKKLPLSFHSQALHYWAEACEMKHAQESSVIVYAMQAFRQRFKIELERIEGE